MVLDDAAALILSNAGAIRPQRIKFRWCLDSVNVRRQFHRPRQGDEDGRQSPDARSRKFDHRGNQA
jgi:hypothetical protein